MIWQDAVIALANVIFIVTLSIQAYEIYKSRSSSLNLINSVTLSLGLYAISFSMLTLELYFSSLVTGMNALLWTVLTVLTLKFKK